MRNFKKILLENYYKSLLEATPPAEPPDDNGEINPNDPMWERFIRQISNDSPEHREAQERLDQFLRQIYGWDSSNLPEDIREYLIQKLLTGEQLTLDEMRELLPGGTSEESLQEMLNIMIIFIAIVASGQGAVVIGRWLAQNGGLWHLFEVLGYIWESLAGGYAGSDDIQDYLDMIRNADYLYDLLLLRQSATGPLRDLLDRLFRQIFDVRQNYLTREDIERLNREFGREVKPLGNLWRDIQNRPQLVDPTNDSYQFPPGMGPGDYFPPSQWQGVPWLAPEAPPWYSPLDPNYIQNNSQPGNG